MVKIKQKVEKETISHTLCWLFNYVKATETEKNFGRL